MFIMMAPFGWGKPVPFNPYNLRDVQRDSMLIALAGPVSNFIQAFALAIIYRIIVMNPVAEAIYGLPMGPQILQSAVLVLVCGVSINLALAFFNLIPLFPLDGEKILGGFLPYEQAIKLEEFRKHSMMILFLLLASGFMFGLPILTTYFSLTAGFLSNLLVGQSFF
jgi:Zn-dependent protease